MTGVSIVTYHTSLDELDKCLSCLTSPQISRIYIVDNGSEKRIADFVKKYDKVEYIASDNVGYGAAHNKAIRKSMAAGYNYHLVMNSDIYFEPSIIDDIVKYMKANPLVGQLHPKMVNPDGTLQYTIRKLPTPFDLICRRFLPSWVAKDSRKKYLLQELDHNRIQNVPYHQGSFLFFKIAALKRVGLFDERFFMYPEDIDISRRMHFEYKTIYYPLATVVHNHRAGSYHNFKLLWIHIVNIVKYFNKWGWFNDRLRDKWNKFLDFTILEEKTNIE